MLTSEQLALVELEVERATPNLVNSTTTPQEWREMVVASFTYAIKRLQQGAA